MQLGAVLRSHYAATQARVASQTVLLAVQDTTTLNYSAHPATEHLGPITNRAEGSAIQTVGRRCVESP